MDTNIVVLVGRLTRDPEMRAISSGKTVASFGLALSGYKRIADGRADGKANQDAVFVDCEAWEKTGEAVQSYCRKGSQVAIQGRLKYESWEDRESGKKRSRLIVVAEKVQFLSRAKEQEQEPERELVPAGAAPEGWAPQTDLPF